MQRPIPSVRHPRFLLVFCLALAAQAHFSPRIRAQAREPLPGQMETRLRDMELRHTREIQSLRSDYEARIRSLEGKLGSLEGELDSVRSGERDRRLELAINSLAQEDRTGIRYTAAGAGGPWDNTFNPAIGLAADFLLTGSDKKDSFPLYNQFRLRRVELQFQGRVDHLASYHFFLTGDEHEVELEEAYAHLDDVLPDTFELRVGRFFASFGRISPIHDHDLPYVDHPQVLQEYLGGNVQTTGLELRHWLPLGGDHVLRWSIGVANRLEGESHAIFGPASADHAHGGHDDFPAGEEEDGHGAFGRRKLKDFAFTGRASGIFELGGDAILQIGLSGIWAPRERTFLDGHKKKESRVFRGLVDGLEEAAFLDVERIVLGADITLSSISPVDGGGFTLHAEVLRSRQNFRGAGKETALGFHAYGEYFFDRHWSLGLGGGFYEHADDSDESSFDIGLFITYRINEFHRLRLEGRFFDDPGEEFFGVMLQYTIFLGHHRHGLPW